MGVDGAIEPQREMTNNIMCQLADADGATLGPSLYLPQNAGPKELTQMVNKMLNNVSSEFFRPFFILGVGLLL